MREIPLSVPKGWSARGWANYAAHMAEASRKVQPGLSQQWAEAAAFAASLAKEREKRR